MWVVLVPFGTVGSKSDQIRDVTITAGLKLYRVFFLTGPTLNLLSVGR